MDKVYLRFYWRLQSCGFSDQSASSIAYRLRFHRVNDALLYLMRKGALRA